MKRAAYQSVAALSSFVFFFSLPEVPTLVDVPCLSAQLDDSLLTIVKSEIFKHGTVASRPPVQIEELIEKPGGILVRWCKVGKRMLSRSHCVCFLPSNLCLNNLLELLRVMMLDNYFSPNVA